MANQVIKISDHKSGQSARDGVAMFTVITGEGKNRKSTTRHMNPTEAANLRKELKAD